MRYAARWMMVSILLVAPLYAESESWVHVVGGAFVVQAKELERMHASLESTVTEAAKAQKKTLPAWNRYLVQFQVSARLNYRGPAGMTPLLILAGSLLGTRSWTVGRAISPSFISSGPAAIRMCCFTDMHDGLFDFREPGSSSRPVRV